MGKKIQIYIGDMEYKTKKEATEDIKAILHGYSVGSKIPEPADSFLRDLVDLHPDSPTKIGAGIDHFRIKRDEFGGRHFHIYRADGSDTDFSYPKCLNGERPSALVSFAMRTAIRHQIVEYRNGRFSFGEVRCPYSNELLTAENCHVDHLPTATFKQIIQLWLTTYSLTYDDVKISPSSDNSQGRTMSDPTQIASWVAFHKHKAQLRILSKLANLSESKVEGNRVMMQSDIMRNS